MDKTFEDNVSRPENTSEQEKHSPVLIKLHISEELQEGNKDKIDSIELLVSAINALKVVISETTQQQLTATIEGLNHNIAVSNDLEQVNRGMSLLREHPTDYGQSAPIRKILENFIQQRLTSQQMEELSYQVVAVVEQGDLDRILNHLHGFFHDFRTPLTSIKGYSELVLRQKEKTHSSNEDNEWMNEGIDTITRNWDRLNNYMDYAAEALLGFFEKEKIEVKTAVKIMVDILKEQLGENISVKFSLDDQLLNKAFMFSPIFLRRLASNIASNSQKADAKNITLTFGLEGGRPAFDIDDDGHGFDDEDPNNPTVSGFKHGHSKWRDRSGTGFGMAELEDTTRHLGGEMKALHRKPPNKGARIHIML